MNFEEALKLLAEKEPEKFRIEDNANGLIFWTMADNEEPYHALLSRSACQDEIDAVLAAIGWECSIEVVPTQPPHRWCADIFNMQHFYDEGSCEIYTDDITYSSKLEAAKAALVAIVEKEYGLKPRATTI